MNLGKSRRGGASAPPACKTRLRSCMLTGAKAIGLRAAAKTCMKSFNSCRSGRKARKGRKGRRR